MTHRAVPLTRLAALLLPALLLPAVARAAGLDDVDLTTPQARNLAALVTLFRDRREELSGELADVAQRLESAPSALGAVLILRQLLPELARQRGFRQSLQQRLRIAEAPGKPGEPAPRPRSTGFASGVTWLRSVEPESRTTLWLEGSSDSAEQDDRDGIDGFDSDASGMMLGLSRELRPGFSLGIAGGGASAKVTTPGRGRDDTDSDDFLAFSNLALGGHRFDMLVSARISETDRQRVLSIPRNGEIRQIVLSSTVDTEELLVSAGWSYDVDFDSGWFLTPGLTLSHIRLDTDDYVESGGGELGLLVATEDEDQTLVSATLGMGYFALAGAWAIAPSAFVSVEHALQADDTVTTSTFTGTRFGFTSRGYSAEKTRVSTGLSVGAYHLSGFGASLGLVHERQNDYRYTALSGTLELTF
ncbi:MAG: autotransporter outer membrane beta-barrel domain-containing protein [Pseudomonadales bacterium]